MLSFLFKKKKKNNYRDCPETVRIYSGLFLINRERTIKPSKTTKSDSEARFQPHLKYFSLAKIAAVGVEPFEGNLRFPRLLQ